MSEKKYKLTENLEANLPILIENLKSLAKENSDKMKANADRPRTAINDELTSERRFGNFQGKAEAYGYAARELEGLVTWFGESE
jgi:ElaB/YqjD/DUF883 family membrane-anchored ribosome-binding protein